MICNIILCSIIFCTERRRKFGKTGIDLIGIFYLGDDQYDTIRIDRNCLDHKRDILCLKTKLKRCLLHHVAEQVFGFFTAIGKLADL